MKFKALFLLLAMTMSATSACALDRVTVYMLQSTLNKHGFSVGEPDGVIGPATKRGINEFAEIYGVSPDAEAVLKEMFRRSAASRTAVTDEEFLKQTKEQVAQRLRDPDSAKIQNVFRVRDAKTDLICGEVNGRNAYGGYAGFTQFYGMSVIGNFALIHADGPDQPVAAFTCALAFPRK